MEHPDAMDIVEVPPAAKSEDEVGSSRTIAETKMASTAENSAFIKISAEEQLAKEHFIAAVGQENRPIYLTETQFKAGPDFNQDIISRLENVEKQLSIMRAEAEGKAARERAELIRQFERLLEQLEHRMAGRFKESMQARHDENNELQSSVKTADSEIQNLWMSLDYNIRCIAHEATKHSLKRHDSLNKSLKGALAVLCSDVPDIYNNDNAQDGVIQAYIWRQICDAVFFQDYGFWQPHAANDFKSARINLLKHAKTLEERCRIGILFSQAHELVGFQVNDKAVAAFAAKEAKAAIGFLTKGDDQVEKTLCEMFQTATKTALQLDSIFISSKAQLQPRWPREGPRFDDKVKDEYIEVAFDNALSKTGRNKPRFKFSITPFVEKRGNAAGYSYADRVVLCKAKAVLG